MLSIPIRQILQVPEPFRAVEAKKPVKNPPKQPSPALQKRLEDLRSKGVPAELKYSRIAREWYIRYHGQPQDWPTDETASAVWKRAVGLC